MSESNERQFREEDLAFFGKISASLSHELNNVLTIIDEYNGLLGDLLLFVEHGRAIDQGKLKGISQQISKQIGRGSRLITRLNKFSHSVDHPITSFDLANLLTDLLALCRRFASLKKAHLEMDFKEDSIPIESNPFHIQHVIFLCIQFALAVRMENNRITVCLEKHGSGARISLTSPSLGQLDRIETDIPFLPLLIESLGGGVEVIHEDERHSVVITLPHSIPGRES